MGYVDLSGIAHTLADGRVAARRRRTCASATAAKTALVGANGAGKTTLLRLIAGDLVPQQGSIARVGGLGVMRQFIGSVRDTTSVQDFLVRARAGRRARRVGRRAALRAGDDGARRRARPSSPMRMRSRTGAMSAATTSRCSGTPSPSPRSASPYDRCKYRELATLSGGEQKRLALELLLRGRDEVLLLDEPDNYPRRAGQAVARGPAAGRRPKTVLFVSHDRELLAAVADRIVTLEGGTAWVHGGGFASYHEARAAKHERMAEVRRRWDEEHARLKELVRTLQQQAKISPDMASRYRAMQTRLEKFEAAGAPPDKPEEQKVAMRLRGGRTGVRAVTCERLELTGLMRAFDTEIFFGERVGVLGSNGAGKSHFLRLLDGATIAHTGAWKLGARVVPGPVRADAHPSRAGSTAPWSTCSGPAPTTGRASTGDGRCRCCAATGSTSRATSASARCPAASRRASRSCCSSSPERPCCCSTSRPTTSTSSVPRRSRRRSRPTRAPSSRSPTTAGSPARSTGS